MGTAAISDADAPLRSSRAPVVAVLRPTPMTPELDWDTESALVDTGTIWVTLPVVRSSSWSVVPPFARANSHMNPLGWG